MQCVLGLENLWQTTKKRGDYKENRQTTKNDGLPYRTDGLPYN
jgi:hypothetical protein